MARFTYKECAGATFQNGDFTITPVNKVLQFTPPGFNGGLIWNRPVALRIKGADGLEQVLPVPDLTRQIILLITAIGMVCALIFSGRKVLKLNPQIKR